jgi:hypothetical protein
MDFIQQIVKRNKIMSQESKIRWIDMIDPVYTLANLCSIDPENNHITGIMISQKSMTIWYEDLAGVARHISLSYDI